VPSAGTLLGATATGGPSDVAERRWELRSRERNRSNPELQNRNQHRWWGASAGGSGEPATRRRDWVVRRQEQKSERVLGSAAAELVPDMLLRSHG